MHAVVTGGAGGLGRAFCLQLAARGDSVVVADVDLEAATRTAAEVDRRGGRGIPVRCDVRDPEQVQALAAHGEVDLIVNNAGVAVAGPFEEIALEDWTWIVDINIWGVVHGCRSFIPAMKARGRGQVINIASAAGLLCAPGMSPYNLTKSAVVGLSETLHSELRAHGVHVTVVCPMFFETGIADAGRGPHGEAEFVKKRMERSRVQADDVARDALRAVERGKLYAIPMADGRTMWWLKRLAPGVFHRGMSLAQRWMDRRRA